MVEVLVVAAKTTEADIVSGFQTGMPEHQRGIACTAPDRYQGKVDFFPLGGPVAAALSEYTLANASSLISLEAFRKIGGYSELRDVGGEDHELYLRALQNGLTIEISPHVAYLYETGSASMWSNTSPVDHYIRVVDRADLRENGEDWRDLLRMIAGQKAVERSIRTRSFSVQKSPHIHVLREIFDEVATEKQLSNLIRYAQLIGKTGIAEAFTATLRSLRRGTGFVHVDLATFAQATSANVTRAVRPGADGTPANVMKAGDQPRELAELFDEIQMHVSAPREPQSAVLNKVRSLRDSGVKPEQCAGLLDLTRTLLMDREDNAFLAQVFVLLAIQAEDWAFLSNHFEIALNDDNKDYLKENPDVARAVEGRAFRSGYHHYVKYGHKEGRTGFSRIDRIDKAIERLSGHRVPLGKTQHVVNELRMGRLRMRAQTVR